MVSCTSICTVKIRKIPTHRPPPVLAHPPSLRKVPVQGEGLLDFGFLSVSHKIFKSDDIFSSPCSRDFDMPKTHHTYSVKFKVNVVYWYTVHRKIEPKVMGFMVFGGWPITMIVTKRLISRAKAYFSINCRENISLEPGKGAPFRAATPSTKSWTHHWVVPLLFEPSRAKGNRTAACKI